MKRVELLSERKAQVLIAVLIAFAIVLTLSAAILMHSRSERISVSQQTDAQRAYVIARSGLNIGDNARLDKTYNVGGGSVQVSLDSGNQIITAKATYNGVTQTLTKHYTPVTPSSVITWAKAYGGPATSTDNGYYVNQTDDGGGVYGYIIGGQTDSYGAGKADIMLIKTNDHGVPIWAYAYGGSGADIDDFGTKAQFAKSPKAGGYVVVAPSDSFPSSGSGTDMLMVKVKADGTMDWARGFRGKGLDQPYAVIEASDGGFLMAVRTYTTTFATEEGLIPNSASVLLIKTDNKGHIGADADKINYAVWTKIYDFQGGNTVETPFCVVEDSTGYIFVGSRDGIADTDAMVVKVNKSDGTILAQKEYGTPKPGNELFYDITPISGGGYAITGETNAQGPAGSGTNALLVLLDTSLTNTVSSYAYDSSLLTERGIKIKATSEGYVIGVRSSNDFNLIRTNSSGGLISPTNKAYGGTGTDKLYGADTANDGFVLAGWTASYGANPQNFLVVKTDSSGNLACAPNISSSITVTETPFSLSVSGTSRNLTPMTPKATALDDVDLTGTIIKQSTLITPVTTPVCD